MTTATTTLTDFLLARIAEDEADLRAVLPAMRNPDPMRANVTRGLAECEAKRRIVEEAATGDSLYTYDRDSSADLASDRALDWVCAVLALPYADHPEYREEWKP